MTEKKQLDLRTLLEGIPNEVKTLKEFVSSARTARQRILEVNSSQDFYLTGCSGCCGWHGTSYRFFAGMPRIGSNGHADTGNKGFIVKIYSVQAANLYQDLANLILNGENNESKFRIGQILYGEKLPHLDLNINRIHAIYDEGRCYKI